MCSEAEMKETKGVKSVAKALRLLRYFTNEKPTWGVRELAAMDGMEPSTAYRLMLPLVEEGLLEQDETTKQYRLGLQFIPYANLVENRLNLITVAQAHMENLVKEERGTANISIFVGHAIYHKLAVECGEGIHVTARNYESKFLHTTATGKLLLSTLTEPELNDYLEKNAGNDSEYPISDIEALKQELQLCRENGYSMATPKRFEGLLVLASPIRDKYHRIMGAVSIYKPRSWGEGGCMERLIENLKSTAKKIEYDMGYSWLPDKKTTLHE